MNLNIHPNLTTYEADASGDISIFDRVTGEALAINVCSDAWQEAQITEHCWHNEVRSGSVTDWVEFAIINRGGSDFSVYILEVDEYLVDEAFEQIEAMVEAVKERI